MYFSRKYLQPPLPLKYYVTVCEILTSESLTVLSGSSSNQVWDKDFGASYSFEVVTEVGDPQKYDELVEKWDREGIASEGLLTVNPPTLPRTLWDYST